MVYLIRAVNLERHCSGVDWSSGETGALPDPPASSCDTKRHK